MQTTAMLVLMAGLTLSAQDFTRGVGVYPGNPKEDFAPRMRVDRTTYRNLALHRAAYHSSSYDYNLTAQLLTDGIVETKLPRWEAVSTSQQGALKKNERQWMFDNNPVTHVVVKGPGAWVRFELLGGEGAPELPGKIRKLLHNKEIVVAEGSGDRVAAGAGGGEAEERVLDAVGRAWKRAGKR